MKKLGVKKLIILALVVVSAITCFGAVAIAFNNNNGINDTESEQYVDIGLDYEDGWYLIKDAEDYYTMTSVVNSGMGQDYKYRLENDVTVGSSAGMNVFSGSFDGNGHTVNLDLDYEEDVNARYSTNSGYVVLSNNTFSLTNLTYTSTLNSGVTVTGMSLLNWSNYHTNVGGEFPEEPKKTKGNVAWKGGDITLTFNSEDGYSGAFGVSKGAYAVGGMFGVLEGATVTNIRFEYISDFKWRGGHNSGQINFFGGLVGLAYQSKISNCIVKRSCDTLEYEDGGCYANIGGIAGRITNNGDYFSEGKITGPNYGISSSIYNCIVIDSNSHYSNYGCI
ncbi:MAG: hypothetical protein J6Q15_03585, partial [Clostridia bacterium]|nr:hypothetical protein [Clostridia bacterium]